MEQTALNIIAIGIFSLTLSALLGPILQISPTIPALITVGIMGLATVDTLNWQNKGITLLLDFFAPSQQRERVLHHEAGHFLVAYLLKIPITAYTLTAWEAFKQGHLGLGGVIFDPVFLSENTPIQGENTLNLERFSTVLMAGIAAETLIYGTVTGGREDQDQLKQALSLARLPATTYQQKENWAKLQAKNLIETHQDAYEALLTAMKKRASVAECYQIIESLTSVYRP
jgi:ATP-dependent Zn protease